MVIEIKMTLTLLFYELYEKILHSIIPFFRTKQQKRNVYIELRLLS